MKLAFKWDVFYDIVFVYSWAVALGLLLGAVKGWAIGLAVMVALAALIYAVERGAMRWGRQSRQTKVPQRRFPTTPD